MAMKKGANQVYKELQEAYVLQDQDAGASTTLSAAAAKGANTITVASATGITAGDRFRISDGNLIEEVVVGSAYTTGTSIPLRTPLKRAHDSGAAVVEREKVITGSVTDQGVRVNGEVSETEITSATDGEITTLRTRAKFTASWSVVETDVEHVALAHAIPQDRISGAGTAASPKALFVDYREMGTLINLSVGFTGVRKDGTFHALELWGADLTSSGEVTYNTGSGAPTPLAAKSGSKVYFEWA